MGYKSSPFAMWFSEQHINYSAPTLVNSLVLQCIKPVSMAKLCFSLAFSVALLVTCCHASAMGGKLA